jgi:hypothetical protein
LSKVSDPEFSKQVITKSGQTPNPKKPSRRFPNNRFFLAEPTVRTTIIWLTTGFIFGYSISIALGINTAASALFGILAGIGVFLGKSLVAYVLIQTILLSSLAGLFLLVFKVEPLWVIRPHIFQIGYISAIAIIPLIFLIPKIRRATASISLPPSVELFTTSSFAALVHFLRSRMPSDETIALSKLYFGEDNAGIVSMLARSLEYGFTSHVSQFGEFINSIYLTAAGVIGWFGTGQTTALLAALTHYNMTLLFMAWVPIAAMLALALSGKKFEPRPAIVFIVFASATLAILFWPFVAIGHTSVISSGLVALAMLALTLNQEFSREHPGFYIVTTASLALIVGTSWFPMMPFAAATTCLAFFGIFQIQFQKGNKAFVLVSFLFFLVLLIALSPYVIELLLGNSGYLAIPGGTLEPSYLLAIIWIATTAFTLWKMRTHIRVGPLEGQKLFFIVLLTLAASNMFLLLGGSAANQGSFGYGASKYFLTSIAFSTPILYLTLINSKKMPRLKKMALVGAGLVVLILLVQPDSRKVPATIVAPNLTSWEFLSPLDANYTQEFQYRMAQTIRGALEKTPSHMFCVSDYGFPAPNSEMNLDSYLCTRWSQSLTTRSGSKAWRMIPLDRASTEDLIKVLENLRNSEVIIIRLLDPVKTGAKALPQEDTWWFSYVDPNWEILVFPDTEYR